MIGKINVDGPRRRIRAILYFVRKLGGIEPVCTCRILMNKQVFVQYYLTGLGVLMGHCWQDDDGSGIRRIPLTFLFKVLENEGKSY